MNSDLWKSNWSMILLATKNSRKRNCKRKFSKAQGLKQRASTISFGVGPTRHQLAVYPRQFARESCASPDRSASTELRHCPPLCSRKATRMPRPCHEKSLAQPRTYGQGRIERWYLLVQQPCDTTPPLGRNPALPHARVHT